ncbi:MAG: MFS transporter [Acidimicrobiales bacterium]|nr:MFS transporter [Acidimicrobiales bacterium]
MTEGPAGTDPAADAPTEQSPAVGEGDKPGFHVRMFGSHQFFRLWLTQVVSATGDWLGFLAIAALATRIGAGSPEAAVGVVMAARIVPGFFLGPASGVIADRFDRKKVMVVCDIGRAAVLATLPFVDTVFGLVVASLVLEVFTLLWTPAKEASVPNLVPADHLTTANSLSLVAAYGTVPIAAGLFSLLSKVAEWLGEIDALNGLRTSQESIAFYVDAFTFLLSALMISRLALPVSERRKAPREGKRIDFGQAFHELKEGWQFVFINPVVRAVNIGLATGLIGGGMLVPLGPVFSIRVLGAGTAGFGLFIFAMGSGVALGVIVLSVFQKRVPKARVFATSLLVGGVSLILAASMSTLGLAALFVTVLGVCAGSVYVLGFTLLHESVDDELRGRIFSALYTLVRFCVLIAFAVGPLLSDLLEKLSRRLVGGEVSLLGVDVAVPGVRLTLWLAGLIIIGAGVLAVRSVRTVPAERPDRMRQGAELMSGVTAPITQVKRSHQRPPAERLAPRDDEP